MGILIVYLFVLEKIFSQYVLSLRVSNFKVDMTQTLLPFISLPLILALTFYKFRSLTEGILIDR